MLGCSDAPHARRAALRVSPPALARYRYVRRRWRVLFAVIDVVGWALVGPLAWALRRLRGARAEADVAPRSILLVQMDHLGDAVLSTALVAELARRFPQARLEVLAAPWNQEVFAACPHVACVHVCRSNRFSRAKSPLWPLAILGWAWQMRQRRFDLGIDARGDFPFALLLWLAGIPRRLGWSACGGGFLLTHRATYQPGRHELASRWALLQAFDEAHDGVSYGSPQLNPGALAHREIERRLRGVEHPERPLLVLHLGAGTPAKRWPAERWRELLGRLSLDVAPVRVVLVGGCDDLPVVAAVTEGQAWPGVTDWTGQLSVAELAALLERADLFVGADSGPAHVAAAAGARVITLFSGTNNPAMWRPVGPRVLVLRHEVACSPCHRQRCPWTDHACMAGIAAERVVQAMQEMLPELTVSAGSRIAASPHADRVPALFNIELPLAPLPTGITR
jgi:lipopolysaccharide heptosyltransferase II